MIGSFRSRTGIGRVSLDIINQAFPIIVSFIDRLVLTAIMLRVLGVTHFEYWSVALSLAALLSILDFGCLMNFSNMVVREKELGNTEKSVLIYHQSNTIFFVIGSIAALGGLLIAFSSESQNLLGLRAGDDPHLRAAILVIISIASGAKLATSNMMAVYRANLLFGRGSIVSGLADLARIAGTCIGVLASGGLIGAALGHLAGTVLGIGAVMFDVRNKAPKYSYALKLPRSADMHGVIGKSLAFAAPLIPLSFMNQGPVLLLNGKSSPGSGVVAVFVLMRTLSNVARILISKVTNVLGMEIARLSIRGEAAVAQRLLDILGWQLAVATGCMGGVALSMGQTFVHLWTGKENLFDPVVLGIMLGPVVLAPSYLLGVAYLQYRNVPLVWTIGTFAQVAVAILIYLSLGDYSELIRVTGGVFGGELFGLALPVAIAVGGAINARVVVRELLRTAVSVSIVIASYALADYFRWMTGARSPLALILASGVAALPSIALAAILAQPLTNLLKGRRI